jgi:hypothetical protein
MLPSLPQCIINRIKHFFCKNKKLKVPLAAAAGSRLEAGAFRACDWSIVWSRDLNVANRLFQYNRFISKTPHN